MGRPNQLKSTRCTDRSALESVRDATGPIAPALSLLLICAMTAVGCSIWSPSTASDDYLTAKDQIEGGNWMRPEGQRAERRKYSSVQGLFDDLPVVGTGEKNPESAKEQYAKAEEIFAQAKSTEDIDQQRKLFRKSAGLYDKAGKRWPSSYLHQDAIMMQAECLFFAEDYPKAEQRYAHLLKEYPRTRYQDRIDARRMEIALYWMDYNREDPQPFYELNLFDNKRPWNEIGRAHV